MMIYMVLLGINYKYPSFCWSPNNFQKHQLCIFVIYAAVAGIKLHVVKILPDLALFSAVVSGIYLIQYENFNGHNLHLVADDLFLRWIFHLQICGIEAPENMPKCINNCHNLESFWKNWHASFNKWLVRWKLLPLHASPLFPLVISLRIFICVFPLIQVHVHSSRRFTEKDAQCLGCIHVCCIVAWPGVVISTLSPPFSSCSIFFPLSFS